MNESDRMKSIGLRSYIKLEEYQGTCYGCQSHVFCQDFICLIVGRTSEIELLVLPVEQLTCPHCHAVMGLFSIIGTHLPNTTTILKPPTQKGLN